MTKQEAQPSLGVGWFTDDLLEEIRHLGIKNSQIFDMQRIILEMCDNDTIEIVSDNCTKIIIDLQNEIDASRAKAKEITKAPEKVESKSISSNETEQEEGFRHTM